MKKFIVFLISLTTLSFNYSITPSFAQDSCEPIFGGGIFSCPTKTPAPSPKPTSIPSTTKGGLKVFSSPNQQTSPATGPELISLFSLVGSAVIGTLLRKKSK